MLDIDAEVRQEGLVLDPSTADLVVNILRQEHPGSAAMYRIAALQKSIFEKARVGTF